MEWLKKHAPIFFSPTFWGLTLSAFAKIISIYGWMDEALMDIIAEWLLLATGVNVIWKGAKKVAGSK